MATKQSLSTDMHVATIEWIDDNLEKVEFVVEDVFCMQEQVAAYLLGKTSLY